MNEDGSTATNQPETPPEAPKPTDPNELEFEMTPEQEADYVDQILAEGEYTPPVPEAPVVEKPTDKAPEAAEVETPPAKAPEAPAPPEKPAETTAEVTAPQTDDLWVEVERVVTDDLGEETTETVKLVYDPNDPSSFIPDDFQAKSTKQLAEIMDAKAEMAKLYEERHSEFEKGQAAKAAEQREKDVLAGWDAEIKDLVSAGILEAPKLKPGEEGYDKDPANVKTDAVFQFMADKNTERAKNGLPPIASFGLAFTMYENSEAKKAEEAAEKKADEDAKAAGALVGGSSAASGGTAEQAAYKAGSHNNIWSVPVED